jgi:hypothetical protein
MIRLSSGVLLVAALGSVAYADITPNDISIAAFNPDQAVAPISTVEGSGIKIGEGTLLRPVFGVETGFVSNVFYTDTDPSASGLLRLLAQIGTSSLGKDRLAGPGTPEDDQPAAANRGSLEYRANLRASYDFMLSSNDTVTETGGLGLGANVHLLTNPQGRFSFGVDDDFTRYIRAANFETDANTNRDINNLSLTLHYHPPDRSVGGYLYFTNTLDIFERSEQAFADRMTNRIGLHPQWQWLPKTMLYGDFSIAYTDGIGADAAQKSSSFPLTTLLGISTLFSTKLIFNLQAGYTNGFYEKGPSYSAPTLDSSIAYQYTPLGRATLGYSLLYVDSINANYYRDHVIHFQIQQLMAPLVFMVQPEIHFREYNGVTVAVPNIMGSDIRNDTIVSVIGGVNYSFRNWIGASINYKFSSVQTDYTYTIPGNTMPTDPSFVRHELLVGVRAAL